MTRALPITATPKKKHHWLRNTILTLVALFAIFIAIGVSGGFDRPTALPTPPAPTVQAPVPSGTQWAPIAPDVQAANPAPDTSKVTGQDNPNGVHAETQPAEQAPAEQAPTGPLSKVTDGSYEVGIADGQMKPGKWTTTGAVQGNVPYAVVKNANEDIDHIVNIDGPQVITLKAGQTFETHGGNTWTIKK